MQFYLCEPAISQLSYGHGVVPSKIGGVPRLPPPPDREESVGRDTAETGYNNVH